MRALTLPSPRPRPTTRVPASLVDPPPSTPVPPPTSRPPPPSRDAALTRLLALAASTDRGRSASRSERAAVDAAAAALEAAVVAATRVGGGDAAAAATDAVAAAAGDWVLVYASAQPFRSSPFFWGLQEAMPSLSIAEAVFEAASATPFTSVGAARQSITGGLLTSRVRLCVAGFDGDMVTEATISPTSTPTELVVAATSTRVEGSRLPGVAGVTVPAGDLLAAVSGGSPPAARVRVSACDDQVRVWRTLADDAVYVWVRE